MKRIVVTLDPASIDRAIKEINDFKKWLVEKTSLFLEELAREGAEIAGLKFATAAYDGTRDVSVTWEKRDDKRVAIVAVGSSALFIEFGSGITYPDSHPEGASTGMVHGSWSEGPEGKGHWDDPNGWYYAHGLKSMGNPAGMCMYETVRELESKVEEIARRVFQ